MVAVPVGTEMLSVLALPGRRVVDLAAQLRGLPQQQVRRRAELLRERPQLLNVGASQVSCHQASPNLLKQPSLTLQAPA